MPVNFEMVFWCLRLLSKNERKQVDLRYHSSKVKFVCLFFGRIIGLKKSLLLCLTFSTVLKALLMRNKITCKNTCTWLCAWQGASMILTGDIYDWIFNCINIKFRCTYYTSSAWKTTQENSIMRPCTINLSLYNTMWCVLTVQRLRSYIQAASKRTGIPSIQSKLWW